MVGHLRAKNATFQDVDNLIRLGEFTITNHKTFLKQVGKREVWNYDGSIQFKQVQSFYMKHFKQDATILPRTFWFVDILMHPIFGIDPNEPLVQSSQRSLKMAKKEYKDVSIKGNIERDHLYVTLLGSDILPFCHLAFRSVILPITKKWNNYSILSRMHWKD